MIERTSVGGFLNPFVMLLSFTRLPGPEDSRIQSNTGIQMECGKSWSIRGPVTLQDIHGFKRSAKILHLVGRGASFWVSLKRRGRAHAAFGISGAMWDIYMTSSSSQLE